MIHFDQNNLESMKGSEFAFNYIHLLFNKCHKIIPDHGWSCKDDWIKYKKRTVNIIKKKDNICFQYAWTVTLKHDEVRTYPQRITNIKPFINCIIGKINKCSIRKRWLAKILEK